MSYLFRSEFVCVLRLRKIVTHVLFVHVLKRTKKLVNVTKDVNVEMNDAVCVVEKHIRLLRQSGEELRRRG